MFTRILITCVLFISLISCTTAKRASEINAVRPPIAPYLKLTCPELITEQRILLTEVAAAGVAVDKAQESDRNTVIVTWLLFAPAAFFIEGNEVQASKYAAQKGQLDTINEALKVNKCGAV
jgi:hypothetical protein